MATTVHGDIEFAPTYYVPSEILRQYGPSISWSRLFKRPAPGLVPVTIIPHAYYTRMIMNEDNLMARANFLALQRDFGCLIEVHFGDGTALAYVGRDDSTEIGGIARILNEHLLYDENYYLRLEAEEVIEERENY